MQKRQGPTPERPAEAPVDRTSSPRPSRAPETPPTGAATSADPTREAHPILAHHDRVAAVHAEFFDEIT